MNNKSELTSYEVDCQRPDSSEWYWYSRYCSLDSAEVQIRIQKSPGEIREHWKFRVTKVTKIEISEVVYEDE